MNQLQPKDIVRYAAYDLHLSTQAGVRLMLGYVSVKIQFRDGECALQFCKPILHTPNLTTPITIKGKTITPLLELAKIAFPDEKFTMEEGLCFSESGCWFVYQFGSFYYEGLMSINVPNQSALFDWMDEHFIDYRGLIASGLAVDVTTLNQNPYA